MTMQDNGVFMEKLLQVALGWNVIKFSSVYGDNYEEADKGRRGYLLGKFEQFRESPLKWYAYLDLSNRRTFVRLVCKETDYIDLAFVD